MPPNAPLGFQTPMPPTNPSTPVPPPMSMPPGANPPSMQAIPPQMDWNRVIAQISAMLDSPDPQTRVMGQAYLDKFARSPGGAFLNRLTQGKIGAPAGTPGISDEFITKSTPQSPAGLLSQRYTPEDMAFGDRLGREVENTDLPGRIHGAEMAGTAANAATAASPFLSVLRKVMGAGGGPSGPMIPAPMSPGGGAPAPGPVAPQGPPLGPFQPPPGWLQRQGRGLGLPPGGGMSPETGPPPMPPPDETGLPPGFPKALGREPSLGTPKEVGPKGQEGIYNRELDKGLPGAEKAPTKSELKKLKLTPAQRKLLGLD
jgi:hypothetical protein